MAAPHVAGAIALLAAHNPNLDWRSLKNLALTGGDSRLSLAQTVTGNRLNLNGSLSCSGKNVESRLKPVNDVVAGTVGVPLTLEELNVDCSQPAGNVQVSVSPGGTTVTLVDDGTGADQAADDGIYTGQWTPSAAGSYTATFPGGDVVPVEVLNNYVVAPTPYNYVSITGTNLNLGDDSVAQVKSPFAVSFGGGSFTTLHIGSNGTISFTDAYSPVSNNVIPILAAVPVTLIAPFWQDLYPVAASSQNVYWAVVGSAPNRQLVVEWRNVRSFVCHSDSSATITFEVIFSESSSNILFEYADTTFGDYCFFQDAGAQATVGVQVSPSVGTMWTVNDPVIVSASALLWTIGNNGPPPNPVPTITTVSPPTVQVGGPAFTLTVNGTGFVPTSAVNFDLYNRPTTYVSSTRLTAEIPASAIGPEVAPSTYIWVQNPPPGGGQSKNVTYPLSSAAPTITSLSPASVTAGSFSFSLTINGTGFDQTQSAVYWNGTLLGSGFVLGPTQIVVGIGYNLITTPGTVQITVVNVPPGGGTSNVATFTILSQAQAPIYLQQHPLLNGHGSPESASPATPTRFLGWKYAARGGPNYLKPFSRRRAQAPLPAPSPALSGPIGNSMGPSSPSGTPPLAGLGLHSLLPADFIPSGVAAGDFNGDGIPDWVVSNGGSNNLWVYLGRGDGTFSQATVIPLSGQSPVAVAAADLRGIGRLDIVVAEADSESIGVFLGNGDGTFAAERTFFVPGAPISLAVADMNHDGRLDLVAGVIPDPNIPLGGPLVTLLGDGAGGFGPPLFESYITFGVQVPESIAVADFEKNGKPDVVVVDPGVGTVVYVNDGTGLLKEAQPISESFIISPLTVAAGDVNEDGCPDVVTLDDLGIARVFLGNCDSTFQSQSTQVGEGDFGWAASLVDVNGDGHLDLVYSGISAQTGYGQVAGSLLAIHFGDGKGNFGRAHVYRGGQTSFALAVADFNRDGHPDVITANQDSDSATIFLNDGRGGFGMPSGEYIGYINGNNSSGPVNSPYTSFTPADVDGDGKPDLVLLELGPGYPNPFQATVMLNDGTGHFGPAIQSPIAEGTSNVLDYLLGDFRNTGRPDLVTLAFEGSNPQLVLAPNVGGGSFGTPRITNISQGGALAAGDFNHDGNLDLAVASGSQTGTTTITIYLGHGDGTFSAQTPISFNTNSPGHWVQGLWVGDFNGDGKLDLLVWLFVNVDPPQNNDVYELLGNGDGTFAPAKLVLQNLTDPAVADFNHDGLPDVVDNRDQFTDYPQFTVPQFRIFLCQPDGSFLLSNTYMP
jgi:FG-GAP-like repeat